MQTRHLIGSLMTGAVLFLGSSIALAQSRIVIPSSSIAGPTDAGILAHTNVEVLVSAGDPGLTASGTPSIPGIPGPPFPGFLIETPASIACVYQLKLPQVPGCNPYLAYMNPTGGAHAIAIVDAFDDATAAADLATFSTQFGLPAASYSTVYAPSGAGCATAAVKPGIDPTGGWELEESLDIEWSHAMAPGATVYLVEALNNSYTNLFCAVQTANALVSAAGGGELSMSWGGGEFGGEPLFDTYFQQSGVVYFASSGDSPGVSYPCASPYVVCVGGTSVGRNINTGNFLNQETGWQNAGGGESLVYSRPGYQPASVGLARAVPDVSAVANPATPVWVYDTNPILGTGWFRVGGTSVASPVWAGIVNSAGSFSNSSNTELSRLYTDSSIDFNDITIGSCGLNMGYLAGVGWDFCSGRGSPRGYTGK